VDMNIMCFIVMSNRDCLLEQEVQLCWASDRHALR